MKYSLHLVLAVFFASLQMMPSKASGELIARIVPPKPSTITKPTYESQLTLKFRDDLKVRAAGGNLTSAVGADLTNVNTVQAQYALSFEQLINLPQEQLDFIEIRASNRSGIARLDLAGMMSVDGMRLEQCHRPSEVYEPRRGRLHAAKHVAVHRCEI